MKQYSEEDIKIINIHIGLRLRLERLKKNISQQDLGLLVGSEGVTIGRLERGEHLSNWSIIFLVSNVLNVNFTDLFKLKNKEELIVMKNECFSLETKLNRTKEMFYLEFEEKINILFLYDK